MSTRTSIVVAASIAFLAVLGLGYLLIPEQLQTRPVLLSVAILAGWIAGGIALPVLGVPTMTGNAARIASLGPVSVVLLLGLVWTFGTVLVSLAAAPRLTYAMILVTIAGAAICFFVLRASAARIESPLHQPPTTTQRLSWELSLENAARAADQGEVSGQLRRLAERVRFASPDPAVASASQNDAISARIADIVSAAANKDGSGIQHRARELEALIDQRENELALRRQ